MKELIIETPAKINFGLNIVSRRDDGYHNLETIFFPVNLFDDITIREDDHFSFTTNNIQLKSEMNNSVIKAKDLFSKYAGIDINASIALKKRIPIGAGMGGGSSDGAAALIGFNQFYNANLCVDELLILALQIGSDAPFFIDPKPKYASSRGEVFKDVSIKINKPILIVNPLIHISTSWAFSKTSPRKPDYSLNLIDQIKYDTISELKNLVTNDFEEVVFPDYPAIKEIKDKMYILGAEFSLMTGSGSTVFGIFPDMESAVKAETNFPSQYFTHLNII